MFRYVCTERPEHAHMAGCEGSGDVEGGVGL